MDSLNRNRRGVQITRRGFSNFKMNLASTFKIVHLCGFAIATILHSLGVFLLYKSKGSLPNQRLLTINLSVCELIYCVYQVAAISISFRTRWYDDLYSMDQFFQILFFIKIRLVFLHIIIDRFLDIRLNIKYPLYINRNVLIKAIVMQWIISSTLSFISTMASKFKIINFNDTLRTFNSLMMTLDLAILVSAISTYIYLFQKVRQALQIVPSQSVSQDRLQGSWHRFRIPCFMVVSYLTLNVSSNIVRIFGKHTTDRLVWNSAVLLDIFGWWADAFIYVLLQRRTRTFLSSLFKTYSRSRSATTNTANTIETEGM